MSAPTAPPSPSWVNSTLCRSGRAACNSSDRRLKLKRESGNVLVMVKSAFSRHAQRTRFSTARRTASARAVLAVVTGYTVTVRATDMAAMGMHSMSSPWPWLPEART